MSKENAIKFLNDIEKSEELKTKVKSIINGLNSTSESKFDEAVKELGYDLTLDEYNELRFSDEEIDIEELENVAGGIWSELKIEAICKNNII